MTKIERFNEMLNKYEFTADEVAFIENEIALITKRNEHRSQGKPCYCSGRRN